MSAQHGGCRRRGQRGVASACLPIVVMLGTPPGGGAETRGYVISMIHTATYANTDTRPGGGNGGPLEFRTRRLVSHGYSDAEALRIIDNGGRDEEGNWVDITTLFGSTAAGGRQLWHGQLSTLVAA